MIFDRVGVVRERLDRQRCHSGTCETDVWGILKTAYTCNMFEHFLSRVKCLFTVFSIDSKWVHIYPAVCSRSLRLVCRRTFELTDVVLSFTATAVAGMSR